MEQPYPLHNLNHCARLATAMTAAIASKVAQLGGLE